MGLSAQEGAPDGALLTDAPTTTSAIDAALLGALDGEPTAAQRTAAREAAASAVRDLSARGLAAAAEQARSLHGALADGAPLAPRALDLSRAAAAVGAATAGVPGERRAPGPPVLVVIGVDTTVAHALTAAGLEAGVVVVGLPPDGVAPWSTDVRPLPRAVLVCRDVPGATSITDAAMSAGCAAATIAPPSSQDADRVVRSGLAVAAHGRADGARILVATEDGVLVHGLAAGLALRGAETTRHTDASGSDAIVVAPPDVVVADARGPRRAAALALAADLRTRTAAAEIGIVLLVDPGDLTEAYATGADDVLADADPEVVSCCAVRRVARNAVLRRAGDSDPLTGLPREREALARLEALRGRAVVGADPFSVAIIAVDGLVRVNEQAGRDAGDALIATTARLLTTALRPDDVIGRLSGGEFVVGGLGLGAEIAVARLESIVADAAGLRPAGVPAGTRLDLSAGVAVHPADGTTALALAQAATGALVAARVQGSGRVLLSDAERRADRTTDILVVEDDRFTAALIEQALAGQGLRVAILRDGAEAADLLTRGDGPRPGVVLLDWELPGLDGPGVLRRMREAGALRDTRVIMLTSRSTEQDVLAVMRAGATDHVPKPFSVPVLLERVRRALVP